MPEELEVPTEQLHETLKEEAERRHSAGEQRFVSLVALTSALIAVAAAVASLRAGHAANEAILEQMRATDQWSFFQSKGIKAAVLDTKRELLAALGKPARSEDEAKRRDYETEQARIEELGRELEQSSRRHLEQHHLFARSVTLSQIAIAMAAISVLVRRRKLWLVSLALGLGGLFFLLQGFFQG